MVVLFELGRDGGLEFASVHEARQELRRKVRESVWVARRRGFDVRVDRGSADQATIRFGQNVWSAFALIR